MISPLPLLRPLHLLPSLLLLSGLSLPADPRLPGLQPASAAALLPVEGVVLRISGNHMPGPGSPRPSSPSPGRSVVAIRGLLPSSGQPLWSLPLPSGRLLGRAVTDSRGRFRLSLPPGTVTLLIEVPGGFYLNSFDGLARFSSVTVAPGLAPLRLVDDRGAVH
ncbi:MAG: carboxypeptidase-like regulatory domain-containing protein [Synechococcaceae cyanobacterium]|nr:carboxypeptidase-like regulatory domain-containing protein [Synechococcaceae cyanobacterium]